jgi:hypothetical protein
VRAAWGAAAALLLGAAARAQQPTPPQATAPPPAAQNPSPMVEPTRAHERIAPRDLDGARRAFAGPLDRPVELFVPRRTRRADRLHLVVHFHGGAFLPHVAVERLGGDAVAAVVQLGSGSGVYDRAFSDPAAFDSLLARAARETSAALGRDATFRRVTLAGFSAGHGAIRAILREPRHFARVDAILLLDGMHASYVPERTVMAAGGTIDDTVLREFVRFAEAATRGEKAFLVTHSEIFPGTFASTTETAEHLLRALGVRRAPVLKWGPRGMQQTSEARRGRFELLGFAGNSAPDHVDHLQAMPELLSRLGRLR